MKKKLNELSPRLQHLVDALPVYPGCRVLEIGCGPGAAARVVCDRVGNGRVLAIDRSPVAIRDAVRLSQDELSKGVLSFLQVKAEDFELPDGEDLFDIAFAIRVGALDGRHPEEGKLALARIAKALKPKGKLFIDSNNTLKEIKLDAYR